LLLHSSSSNLSDPNLITCYCHYKLALLLLLLLLLLLVVPLFLGVALG